MSLKSKSHSYLRRLTGGLIGALAVAGLLAPGGASTIHAAPVLPHYVGTLAGPGLADMYPVDIALFGNRYYVMDPGKYSVSAVNRTTGAIDYTHGGTQGTKPGEFAAARSIATDSAGNVYVADTPNNRIEVFSPTLTYLGKWGGGGTGPGKFSMVYGVATGIGKLANGSTGEVVYTTDGGRVQEFGVWPTPTFIRQFGSGMLNQPRKLAVDPATNDLFVVSARDQHVVVFNTSGVKIGQFGSTGSGNGQFLNDPRGVTISNDGIVFVSDSGNKRIEAFSSTGPGYNYLYQFGQGDLVDERGLIATPDGKVAVTDEWGFGLKVYDYTGTGATLSRSLFGTPAPAPGFDAPRGMDIDPSTGQVYVVDWWNQRIESFDQTGTYMFKWGQRGPKSVPGSINFAWSLAVRPSNGYVYVANRESHEIEVFDSAGNYLLRWGNRGNSTSNQFTFPQGAVFDDTTSPASLLIADSGNGRIIRYSGFTGVGKGISESLFGSIGSAAGQFKTPTGLSVAANGNIWVADTQNNRIQRCSSSGSSCTAFAQPTGGTVFKSPWGVTVAPDGNIWVADSGNDRIVEMTPSGTQVFSATGADLGVPGGTLNAPFQISFAPSGTIYVSVVWDNRVIELAP